MRRKIDASMGIVICLMLLNVVQVVICAVLMGVSEITDGITGTILGTTLLILSITFCVGFQVFCGLIEKTDSHS